MGERGGRGRWFDFLGDESAADEALAEDGPADCDQPVPVEPEGMMEMRTKQRSEVKTTQDLWRWTLVLVGGVTDNCCLSFEGCSFLFISR